MKLLLGSVVGLLVTSIFFLIGAGTGSNLVILLCPLGLGCIWLNGYAIATTNIRISINRADETTARRPAPKFDD